MTRVSLLLTAIIAALTVVSASGDTLVKNRPILDAPITQRKLVVAHYMTGMLFHQGKGRLSVNLDPTMYRPDGPSAAVGGLIQTQPMTLPFLEDRTMDASAAFEVRAARELGIDGFQFYYPLGLNSRLLDGYNEVIKAFFRAVEREQVDFQLTLCLSIPEGGTQRQKTAHWSRYIRELLAECGDSKAWLKTPDGRYLFYTWCPDSLAETIEHHWMVGGDPKLIGACAQAYEDLADACVIEIAYIYHLRFSNDPRVVEAALDYFPAIWGWTESYADDDPWEAVAARARQRRRAYTQTVYPDYYTSKVYPRKKGARMLFTLDEVLAQGVGNLERHTQICGLSYLYRRLLERAVKTDASLINYVTWNDYPEGHHLAPEINHNFGFALLLQHYKNEWLGQENRNQDEFAVVFFKKYPHDTRPSAFDFHCHVKEAVGEEKLDDGIEVVTRLETPAELIVNGRSRGGVERGLVVTKLPFETGRVSVQLKRGGIPFIEFTTPEAITDAPYRTDRLTYAYSSEFDEFYRRLFGAGQPPVSDEYAPSPDGQPQWRTRVWYAAPRLSVFRSVPAAVPAVRGAGRFELDRRGGSSSSARCIQRRGPASHTPRRKPKERGTRK